MNKHFNKYLLIWAIFLAAFAVIALFVRQVIPGTTIQHDARFWIIFCSIIVAFLGNLVCAAFAFSAENLQKLFYKVPLITISYSALIILMIAGSAMVLIPNCTAGIAVLVCVVIIAFSAIAVVKTAWAVDVVQVIDEKIKIQTSFINELNVQAKGILARSQNGAVRAECQKVCDAVRYSDPISNEALSVIEAKITIKMNELSTAVRAGDEQKVKVTADEVLLLINDRNQKCKATK